MKFLSLLSGQVTEKAAVVVSAGAANAGDVPALDGTGRLDSSVIPSVAASSQRTFAFFAS